MDPYNVLGVNKNATDQEIKNAYKNLIKKYHPDKYVNNPLSDLALEKTKEINEAYDMIMNTRKNTQYNYNTSSNSYYQTQFQDIRNMINSGRIIEAEEILDGVSEDKKSPEWYYLKGVVYYKRGWLEESFRYISTARQMDPNNNEYNATFNSMFYQQNGNFNGNPYAYRRYSNDSSLCGICQTLICLDCCCECMGGDFISCC